MAVTLQVFSSPELLSKDTALGRELTLEGKGGFVGGALSTYSIIFLGLSCPTGREGKLQGVLRETLEANCARGKAT